VKTTRTPARRAIVLLSAALAFLPLGADATVPRARRAEGKVLAVDRQTNTMSVKPPNAKRPLLLRWDKSTRFVHNQQFTNSAALTEGLPVAVFYRSPLFGKLYVTKVLWENGKN